MSTFSSLPDGVYRVNPKVVETAHVLDYCPVKPGTLRLSLGGRSFVDDGKGKIVSDHDRPHGVGTIDYDTGRLKFFAYFMLAYEYDPNAQEEEA